MNATLDSPWRDWGASLGVHALAVGVLVALTLIAPARPLVQRLDMAVQWERPPETPPLAPLPTPLPPPPVPTKVPPLPTPTPPTPTPPTATPTLAPAPESVATHADTVVPAAPTPPQPVAAAAPPAPPPVAAAPDPGTERRWQALFESLLLRHKQYPISARRARQEGVVTIDALFDPDGALVRCAVLTGSGFSVLDEAALGIVQRAAAAARAQLAPGRKARLTVPVTFNLEES